VENAVRHGVEPLAGGGHIEVRTQARRGMVQVTVRNTVGQAPPRPGAGIALANVRERLRLLHDMGATLEAARDGEHFVARLVVPL
jgi:two-component system, LytTR family, sensor histidine kinase AlgZ